MANLTGRRFNHLTVMKRANDCDTKKQYLCLCDCGKEIVVSKTKLIRGVVKSCGCKAQRKYNGHNLRYTYYEDCDGLLNLRMAIINQAIIDYRQGNKEQKALLEEWFLSDYGQFISGDMGEVIVEKLRKEYK